MATTTEKVPEVAEEVAEEVALGPRVVLDKNAPVTNLVAEAMLRQVEISEVIDESVNPVPAEHLKNAQEIRIEERLHYV